MNIIERIRAYADPALCLHLPAQVAEGQPFVVKDNIDVAGMPTTAGCPSFAYQPAADAEVVARLRVAGCVPVAKVNLDQFATGLVGTRSPSGTPRNPFDATRIPGGSSSGSACAVAAGLVPFALGTDTAGSGRVPAALQNLVGLKPTKGWLSTRGVVPAVRSLDCVSVFALTVDEAWRVANLAGGFDPSDPFSRPRPEITLPSGRLRVGMPAAAQLDGIVDPALLARYHAAAAHVQALGHELLTIDYAPFLAAAQLLYGGAWVAERTAAVGDFLDRQPAGADPIVAGIIRAGRAHDAVAAWRGTYALAELRRAADQQWRHMDVLLLPTVCAYPTLAEVAADPIGVNSRLGRFTNFANLLDTCALAVPAGFAEGLPAGVTLFAPAWHDGVLARLGAALHQRQFELDGLTLGALGTRPETMAPLSVDDEGITVAVFGAHLQGQPLNGQLRAWGATLVGPCVTTPVYRMHLLPGALPRPGLVRVSDQGVAIAGELWRLPPAGFGRLVASISAPLAIGTVTCAGIGAVKGFVCEAAGAVGTRDISAYGDWRGFLSRELAGELSRELAGERVRSADS